MHETGGMATTEERLDALVEAVNELGHAVMAMATNGQPDAPPRTNAGKAAAAHLERVAVLLFDAKPQ